MKYGYFVDEADVIFTLSNFQCAYPTPSPTTPPTPAYKGCFPQGECNDGYMDKTNGNTNNWACGGACVGGQYLTDNSCACACVPYSETCNPTPAPVPAPTTDPTEPTCTSHSDCDSSTPFCFGDDGGGYCDSCNECHYCSDGIDGTCGSCGTGYPLYQNTVCTSTSTSDPDGEAWLFEVPLDDLVDGTGSGNTKRCMCIC